MASQITSLTFVYSAVYSGADPVTRKMFPFDGVIMVWDDIINAGVQLSDTKQNENTEEQRITTNENDVGGIFAS